MSNALSAFAEAMKLVEEKLDTLEQQADAHVEALRDFVEETLEWFQDDELSFKQRVRMNDARLRLARVLKSRTPTSPAA